MQKHTRRYVLTALLTAAAASGLLAQTEPAAGETVKLEKFEVNSVPIEQSVLPTSRPFNSVFGTNDDIVDVPRNVTIISRQQLTDIGIEDVLDFAKLTSSSYTTTNFGAPSNPSIRGQSADTFVNGVRARITSNGNGLPLDFNSVESVNIVKGPATAVQGASMYVGGFIDLITKRPYFDGFKGSASYTIGSYGKNKWTLDIGGPSKNPELAYRFSYSGEDSDSYYIDGYKKTQSVYGAITWRPSDKYELFINSQFFYADYTENWGMNRPTQDLIDNGRYVTGINVNNGVGATPSDAQNSKYVLDGGNVIAYGPAVTINRHNRLLKPGDHSLGREYNFQAIQTAKISDEATLKNTSYFSYTARNTLSSYYYSEIIDPSYFAENRTEFIFEKEKFSVNTGLDLRYQRTKAYDDYFFEPSNVWDLTKDHALINVYNADAFYGRFVGQEVPGWPGRYATQGIINGDTNDSEGITVGPFVQGTYRFSDKLSLVTGLRYDFMRADVTEPLPPIPAHDTINVSIPNVNGSLVYKLAPPMSVYFTYNYSENTSGAVGNGGGITGWGQRPDGSYFLDKENFTQPSTLYELGTKYSLLDSKLFLGAAVYDQKRTAKNTSSTTISEYHYKGFEVEANYQPNKNFYTTFAYAYISAKKSAGFQSDAGVNPLPGQVAAYGIEGRVSGLPQNQFNALFNYTFDSGLGFSVNGLVTSEINNNFAGTLVIPWQYEIDATAFYTYKDWGFQVSVKNLTDEKNWAPPNDVYGNGSILALEGTQVSFTVKYRF